MPNRRLCFVFAVATGALAVDASATAQRPNGGADVRVKTANLGAADPAVRAQAACELREAGDRAAEALAPLIKLLSDGSPVDARVCGQRWWRGDSEDVTTPGELAAAALASIGSAAVAPLIGALAHDAWIARRNAAWALGALDDARAVNPLVQVLADREPAVRRQAAWALGAIDDRTAVPALVTALKDDDPAVRKQSAWALGAIDDSRALDALIAALADGQADVREQAAWALGVLGDSRALNGLLTALKDTSAGVRRQAAWAIGVIGR